MEARDGALGESKTIENGRADDAGGGAKDTDPAEVKVDVDDVDDFMFEESL